MLGLKLIHVSHFMSAGAALNTKLDMIFNFSSEWLSKISILLRWRHNGHNSVSNHQPYDCLLKRLFRRISKKTSKLRVTVLYAGNSHGTGEFPVQMVSYAENVSIWWRHHVVSSTSVENSYRCYISRDLRASKPIMLTYSFKYILDEIFQLMCVSAHNYPLFAHLVVHSYRSLYTKYHGLPRWAPEGREVFHYVVVIDRFHCIDLFN